MGVQPASYWQYESLGHNFHEFLSLVFKNSKPLVLKVLEWDPLFRMAILSESTGSYVLAKSDIR